MELHTAQILARQLMDQHGLSHVPFKFDRSQRRLGCFHWKWRNGVTTCWISLSKYITLLNDEKIITNVILHEIAHALVERGNGHNRVWKRKALEIGCDGKRLSSFHTRKEGRWQGTCPKCHKVHHRYRRTRAVTTTRICHCGGKFRYKDTLQTLYSQVG
jgi:hypothetical protein